MSASNTVWQGAGRRIHMQEVGLRDGLQMEKAFVPTADKIALCNALSAAGLSTPPWCPTCAVPSAPSSRARTS